MFVGPKISLLKYHQVSCDLAWRDCYVYTALAGAEYGPFTMVEVMSQYTPPSMLTKLNTFFMLMLIPVENSKSWSLMYYLKVSLFHRPIF